MTDSQDWGEAWLQSQAQALEFWNNWLSQLGDGAAAVSRTTMPEMPGLDEGVDKWWETVSGGFGQDAQAVLPKLLDATKNYFDMGESMWKVLETLGNSQHDWQTAVNTAMEQFQQNLEGSMPVGSDAWNGFADSWGLDSDVWNRFVSNNSLGGFNPAMNPIAMLAGPGAEAYQRMFHTPMPAVGANREWQEKIQHWMDLSQAYGKAVGEYGSLLQEANSDAVNILGDTLRKGGMENAPENLRGMYDLWVDSGEAAYAKLAMDERFVKAQAEQMNALFRLKTHEQCMADDYLQMLNIPSRRELDSAHKRLQDARREIRGLRERLMVSEQQAQDLRQQLRAEFEEAGKRFEADLGKEMERSETRMTRLMERTESDAAKATEAANAARDEALSATAAAHAEIEALKAEMRKLTEQLNARPAPTTARPSQTAMNLGDEQTSSTPKPPTKKKATVKKAAVKKAPARKAAGSAAGAAPAKKAPVKKAAAKKPAVKKSAPGKKAAPKTRSTASKATGDKQS